MGYQLGSAFFQAFADVSGGETLVFISGTGSWEKSIPQLDLPPLSENAATKLSGAIVPLESGPHRFYIASRNDSQLYLDTDGDGEMEEVAVCTEEPADYDWTANANQQSITYNLVAGQSYQFQVLHKTDRFEPGPLAVGWTTPSNPSIEVIDASVLASPVTESMVPAIVVEPSDYDRRVSQYMGLIMTLNTSDPALFQWYRNGIPFGPPDPSAYFVLGPAGVGSEGQYHCVATVGNHVLTSRTATVTISNDGEIIDGSLWMDFFTETNGGDIADLTDDIGFPWLTDSFTSLTSFAYTTPVQNTNQVGHRVTGWLIPEETANYRLLVTGDDRVNLYLSPTEFAAHKELLIETTRTSNNMTWSDSGTGVTDYIPLIAGQRYYVELLHKEDRGASHFAVAWQKEGDPMPENGSDAISSQFLQSSNGGYITDAGPIPPFYPDELYLASYLDEATYQDPILGGRFGNASSNGLVNVFYYLFNLGDPTQSAIPKIQTTPTLQPGVPLLTKDNSGETFTYSYVHPRTEMNLTLRPMMSSDLSSWHSMESPSAPTPVLNTTVENIDDNYEIRHLQFSPPEGVLFFRMEVHEITP